MNKNWTKRLVLACLSISLVLILGCGNKPRLPDQSQIKKTCEFAQKMPKVELHVHLEGSIQPALLFDLARKNHVQLPAKDATAWKQALQFKDFNDFVRVYRLVVSCLRTKQDYASIAYAYGASCAHQNIRYAEGTFTLLTPEAKSPIPWKEVLKGLNEGRDRVKREFGVTLAWIFDVAIGEDVRESEAVYNFVRDHRSQGIVAFGLSSTKREQDPVSRYAYIFDQAHKDGIPLVIHAGEFKGGRAIDMYDAIYALHADRIGHGVMCIYDAKLRQVLHQRQIPLEICVTSNVKLKVFPNYAAHPVRQLWDDGLFITINSDDPGLFDTDLVKEYELLVKQYHFTEDELERVSLNGIRASLLPAQEKRKLEVEFKAAFAMLREIVEKQYAACV